MTILQKPLSAYKGEQDFSFVCYSHQDANIVYADITMLQEQGVKVWFDEGIAAGSSWRAEIANAITRSKKFLFFISKASLHSTHCLREVDFALNHDIEIIPIYLEEVTLPIELELSLARIQALYRKQGAQYERNLVHASKRFSRENQVVKDAQTQGSPKWRALLLVGVLMLAITVIATVVLFNQEPSNVADNQKNQGVLPSTPIIKYLRANDYLSRWDKTDYLSKAINLYKEVTVEDPQFALAYSQLAESYRIKYVLSREQEFIDLAQANIDKAFAISRDLAPIHVAVARVNLTQGQVDLAHSAVTTALDLDPVNPSANQAMALVLQRQSKFEQANEYFDKAQSLAPDNLVILDSYANFLFDQGEIEKASGLWERVINLAPDHYAAIINRGSALSYLGNNTGAIKSYLTALQIRPSYMAYSNLGVAYSENGQNDLAIDAYKKALEIDSSDWLVWGNLGYSLGIVDGLETEASDAYDKAIKLAEKAREKDPRDIWANSDLALYYTEKNENDLALERITTALTLAPDSAEVHIVAAQVYQQLGDIPKAKEYIQLSLDNGYTIEQIQMKGALKDLF